MTSRATELMASNHRMVLDSSIIIAYLIFTLYIGIKSGHGVKTLKQFAISDRKFSSVFIVATIFSTVVGAPVIMGTAQRVFNEGLIVTVAGLGWPLGIFLISKFLMPRSGRFLGLLSSGDIVRKLYGKTSQVIVGVASCMVSIGYVAAQVGAMGYLFYYFVGIPKELGVLIGFGIVITYSTFGGMKSVVTTDVLQFVFIILMLPMVFTESLSQIIQQNCLSGCFEGIKFIFHNAPDGHINIFSQSNDHIFYSSLFLACILPALDPSFTQRILITSSSVQAKKAMRVSAVLIVAVELIDFSISIMGHSIAPNANSHVIFLEILNKVLYPGLKGFAVSGLIAAIMSSADSDLNAASVAIVNDVVKPLSKKTLTDKQCLNIARISTAFFGVFSIVVALKVESLYSIMIYSFLFYMPIVIPQIIAGFFYKEGSSKTFIISAVAGALVAGLWDICLSRVMHVYAVLPGILANFTAFLLSRRFLDKLKWNETITGEIPIQVSKPRKASLYRRLINNFAWFRFVYDRSLTTLARRFCDRHVSYYGTQHIIFGIFGIIAYVTPFFLWSDAIMIKHLNHIMRIVGGALCVGLVLKKFWKPENKKYFSLFWYSAVAYCLVILPTFWMWQNHCSFYWLINITLMAMLLSILVDWTMFLVIQITGIIISSLLYKQFYGFNFETLENVYYLIYIYVLTTLFALLFSKRKEEGVEYRLEGIGSVARFLDDRFRVRTVMMYNNAENLRSKLNKFEPVSSASETKKILKEAEKHMLEFKKIATDMNNEFYMLGNNLRGLEASIHKGFEMSSVQEEMRNMLKMQVVSEDIKRLGIKVTLHDDRDFLMPNDNSAAFMLTLNLVRNAVTQIERNYLVSKAIRPVIHKKEAHSLSDSAALVSNGAVSKISDELSKQVTDEFRDLNSGGEIDIWIVNLSDGRNEIHVKDNGGGVDPEIEDKIFKEFFTGVPGKAGLGLAYCKHVLSCIDGYIALINNPGESAEFILHFPKWKEV